MADDFWWRRSLCAEVDTEAFFPPLGSNANDARDICKLCKVRVMCLADAITPREEIVYGIWGGFGRDTRRVMQRRVQLGEPPLVVAAQAIAMDRHRRG